MRKFPLFCLLGAALLLLPPTPAWAGKKAARQIVIQSVKGDTITVTNHVNVTITYKINAFTDIELSGLKVPQSELQPGMQVQVTTDGPGLVASVISATPEKDTIAHVGGHPAKASSSP